MPVIAEVIAASKEFISGDSVIVALKPSSMALSTGKVTLIIGPSGSGKTTLLSLIGCVIYPSSGEVIIDGIRTSGLSARNMAGIRLNKIGFIFQQFNLLAPLTAEQNVMLPLTLLGIPDTEAKGRVRKVLEQVNMSHRAKSLPKMMSGGEQQRIAIARALVTDAPIMLCDEPTASLDTKSAHIVMEELRKQAACGKAVAIVTHDMRLKPYADEIIYVENGQIGKTDFNEPI
jgi:putative ABC transport system ATP-binding protein